MRKMMAFCFGTGLLFCTATSKLRAQEERTNITEENPKGRHQLSLILGHSHLFTGIKENGNRGWLVLPAWGFDYWYWLGKRWSLGLQSDIITETFKVEKSDHSEILERTSPFAIMASGAFSTFPHQTLSLGMGAELAKEGNFALSRIGYEWGWAISRHWEFSVCLNYDFKWKAYDTWTLGFAVTRTFSKHH